MIQRIMAVFLLLFLAACAGNANEATQAVEVTELAAEASEAVTETSEVSIEATESSGEATEAVEATESSVEATEAAEATETVYAFVLDAEHTTTLSWGGQATFDYPAEWRIRDTSRDGFRGEITIYAVDGYNLSISINNDPSNRDTTAESLLNRMNQNNSIETSERNGYTLYYTITRGGNGLAAITYIEGTTYAFIEIVNTQSKDLEAMLETAFSILTSVEIIPEEAE